MKNLIVFLLFPLLLSCTMKQTPLRPDADNGGLTLPDGFAALIVADSVGPARHLAVDTSGVIYVSLREKTRGGGIAVLRDNDGNGRAELVSYHGDYQGTGIGLYREYLYFGTDTSVILLDTDKDGNLVPGFTTIVGRFPLEYQHAVKPFTFDEKGNLYVNVGAPSNSCAEEDRAPGSPGMDPCPLLDTYGGIWQFSATETGQVFGRDGQRFATGIRNAVALDWNRHANRLYLVQHGRDQLYPQYDEHFDVDDNARLPAEEFFLVNKDDNFGWPYCYYDHFQEKKVLAPEYGGDGQMVGRCDTMKDPFMAFPAHYAPNDLLFYEGDQFPERYKHGAFVAFHGSWNRAPKMQEGFNVVFVPFTDSLPSGDWEVFADGFAGIDPVPSPGDARHRPCGLAVGPDGSLYVADSKFGRIWRIFYQGNPG